MGKDKVEIFNLGLCPKCLEIVNKPEDNETCVCGCGEHMNFHIAHLLLQEAIYQGGNDILKRIVEMLPDIFATSHGRVGVRSKDLSGIIRLKDIVKYPDLFQAVVREGSDIVSDFILARQIEIKEKYGFGISRADAATILAFKNIMRTYEEDTGDMTRNIVVQNLDELEKNELGEFPLSYRDCYQVWHNVNVGRSDSVTVCQPDVNIRYENKSELVVHAYIKSEAKIFVAALRDLNFPRGSRIYIFSKGVIAS